MYSDEATCIQMKLHVFRWSYMYSDEATCI